MEEYAAAKAKLFFWPSLPVAVVNADDNFGLSLKEQLRAQAKPVLTYGLSSGDVRGANLQLLQNGLRMQVTTPQGDANVFAPVLGRFNAYNVLAVLSTLLALEISLKDAVAAVGSIKPVLGRMQQFGGDDKPLVVVDYAHTPDALEKVLATLREQLQGESQLICVFGCGGDRDAGKRPLMGEVAAKLADMIIVTSDNPRTEDPAQIIAQVVRGVDKPCLNEPDRAVAIQRAVGLARAGDIVLLAGKGHENYQEIKGVRTPFSDAALAMAALNDRLVMSGVRS
jgi:UDP-N-acetylmuramyl-tripeptide synthetase